MEIPFFLQKLLPPGFDAEKAMGQLGLIGKSIQDTDARTVHLTEGQRLIAGALMEMGKRLDRIESLLSPTAGLK